MTDYLSKVSNIPKQCDWPRSMAEAPNRQTFSKNNAEMVYDMTTHPASQYRVDDRRKIGAEFEVLLRRRGTLEFLPTEVSDAIKAEVDAILSARDLKEFVTGEIDQDIIETKTQPFSSPEHLRVQTYFVLRTVVMTARKHGAQVVPFSVDPLAPKANVNLKHPFIGFIARTKHGTVTFENCGSINCPQFHLDIGEWNATMHAYRIFRALIPVFVAMTSNSALAAGRDSRLLAFRVNQKCQLLDNLGFLGPALPEDIEPIEYYRAMYELCNFKDLMLRFIFDFNGSLRIRPANKKIGLEMGFFDTIPDLRVMWALVDFLNALLTRVLYAYAEDEPLPWFLATNIEQALTKSLQWAVKDGLDAKYLAGRWGFNEKRGAVPMRELIFALMEFAGQTDTVGGDWAEIIEEAILADGTPAHQTLALYYSFLGKDLEEMYKLPEDKRGYDLDVPEDKRREAIVKVANHFSARFEQQFDEASNTAKRQPDVLRNLAS